MSQKIDPVLQEIADKIQVALPAELAAATHFSVDEKGERLLLDFAVKLEKADYPLILALVKKFGGDFGNRKEGKQDVGFFFVPKSALTCISDKSANVTNDTNVQKSSSPAPSTPAEEPKAPEIPKQPSPITQFASNFCNICADSGSRCNSTTVSGREVMSLCLRTVRVQVLQLINTNLEKINAKMALQVKPVVQESPAQQAAGSEKVQRSTRPTEGHKEDGIVWVNDVNSKGESIEKAFEKDNVQSSSYFALKDQIVAKVNAGKKGLELNGKWHWLYENGSTIGRKPAKQFPQKGARR